MATSRFLGKFLRGKIGQQHQAGVEGRKLVLGRIRAVAVGRIFFEKISSKLILSFFKQKTAYEIDRRDWSSDVCSSDLYAQIIKILK